MITQWMEQPFIPDSGKSNSVPTRITAIVHCFTYDTSEQKSTDCTATNVILHKEVNHFQKLHLCRSIQTRMIAAFQ